MTDHIQCPKTGKPVATCDMLIDLLCVAHRDGGHYFTEHGIEQAHRDARDLILEAYHQRDWYTKLLTYIRDNAKLEFGGEVGLLAFQKLKEAALTARGTEQ